MTQPGDFVPRTEFKATIPPHTHLVSAEFVRALRGCTAESVQALVESGKLRFAWNVSERHAICELRIWLQEVVAPVPANLALRDVIKIVLGEHRTSWRGAEVAQLLLLSRPGIHRLHRSGALPGQISGHTLWIRRPALEKFLNVRWLGSAQFQPN